MCSQNEDFLEKCHKCLLINICMWCPAHAYLETGELDKPVEYFWGYEQWSIGKDYGGVKPFKGDGWKKHIYNPEGERVINGS